MDYVTLGRTGLRVSVAGLGCGGFSRLGLGSGKTEAEAVAVVRRALELGVTLFDTAAAYGTEGVVGQGLKGVPRDSIVITTKAMITRDEERNIFARPERVGAAMRDLAAQGLVPQALADLEEPLGFLIHDGGADSLTDAAYRYARHEPGIDVVLFGTGNVHHMETNVASLLKPPLPAADRARLADLFGHLRGVGLEGARPAKP
jgi:aryl-alcohol dehydrogenase-like predicted oxidoreductase